MNQFYDKQKNRLVFIDNAADKDFWDKHWESESLSGQSTPTYNSWLVNITKKYLNPDAVILEGGCGVGDNVFSLNKAGFRAYGIDYAEKTVETIKKNYPELNVRVGDVMKTGFDSDFFDGYWSLGVIEHFYDGYDAIIDEMRRIIKPGGYLFLTFPVMSRLRRIKAYLGGYENWAEKEDLVKFFYQFALPEKEVRCQLSEKGFSYVSKQYTSAFKGLKDEAKILKGFLQTIYESKSFPAKCAKGLTEIILKPFSPHMVLMIFKKNEK